VVLFSSTTSLSRVIGDGGEKFHWITAVPDAIAQNAIWATRKSGPLYGGLFRAPLANDAWPGVYVTPRNTQLAGPLHTSFWSVASKMVESTVTVLVSTQPVRPALTFCRRVASKV
jgi:hypothetical protein